MGINTQSNSAVQEFRLTSGGTISANDVVTNTGSGYAFPVNPVLSSSQINQNTDGVSTILGTAAFPFNYSAPTFQKGGSLVAQLSNNSVAVAYSGDGTALNDTNVYVGFLPQNSQYASVTVQPSSAASITSLGIRRITTVGVVCAWTESATLKFAIYSNSGATIKAATTVITLSGGTWGQFWHFNVLSNGSIVFFYRKSTNDGAFTIYDSTGTIVGTEVIVEATSQPNTLNVTPLANGGFVTYYYKNTATNNWKFARYNSTGVLQGSLTTITVTSPVTAGQPSCYDQICAETANGNLVFCMLGNPNWPRYAVYNSSGTLVLAASKIFNNGSWDDTTNYMTTNASASVIPLGSGFVIQTLGTGYLASAKYDNNGAKLGQYAFGTSPVANGPVYQMPCMVFTGKNIVSALSYNNVCTSSYSFLYAIDVNLMASLNVTQFGGGSSPYVSICKNNDGSVSVGQWQTSASAIMYYGCYNTQRTSTFGVAEEAATSGSSFRVATQGSFATNQNFTAGFNFDLRTATTPGTKGSVAGTSASLLGIY